jgi:tRNA (guanine37-N1)-methyltransferase
MKIQVISLFPEMFEGVLNSSMLFKAQKINAVKYELINLRDYGIGPRKQVDDIPYGGGDGMVLKPEPIIEAITFARNNSPNSLVILPTPRGDVYRQSTAKKLALDNKDLIIVCPRYEGYDERIIEYVDMQICIGNYVLTGGEIPAMIIVDSVTRLLPGVLGGETSVDKESFQDDDITIEHPQYTRPEEYLGKKVPDVLLSGHHAEIDKWRSSQKK